MNILFILPQQAGRFHHITAHQGIQSLSSFLKIHDKTIKTHLLRLERVNANAIASCIKDFGPALACITSTSLEIKLAAAISDYIHKRYNLPAILGGIHATIKPEECLQRGSFDAVCAGEGEEALLDFVKSKTQEDAGR